MLLRIFRRRIINESGRCGKVRDWSWYEVSAVELL